jgi:PAS domain S-box-containing protein
MSKQLYRSLQDPETLRMLIENLPVGVYISTLQGELLDANPACLEILGVGSIEELRSCTTAQLYADPAQREAEIQKLKSFGSIRNFELKLRRLKDGQVRFVLDTCYGVKDFKTNEVFYHGILLDITERRHLEERLKERAG